MGRFFFWFVPLQAHSTGSAERREVSFAHVHAAHAGRGQGTIRRIIGLTLRHPWQVAIALGSTVIAVSFQLSIPMLLGRAVDQAQGVILSDAGASALFMTGLMLLGASVLRGLFTLLQNYYAEAVGHHTGYELRLAVYEKIQRLPFSFHDKVHSGDLITVGMLDLEGVRVFFSTGLLRVILLGMLIGLGAYLLISTDPVLGLLALSFVPFVAWRSSVSQIQLRRTWLVLQDKLQVLSRVMEENLGGIRVVRAFAGARHEMEKFEVASSNALDLQHERVLLRVRATSTMTFAFFLSMGLVLLVGGEKVIAGEMTVGTLTSFLTFMTILQMPVRQLGLMVNGFARASTCGARLFALLDTDIEIRDRPGARPLGTQSGELRFEAVDFAYPSDPARLILKGVSFAARPGETVGIVGPPGSGKSTIAHLIPRFYDVTGGAITLDGQDIREVTLESLRARVGVVQQDPFLFTTTIENNIAYGDPWAKDQRIERAAESAQLHNYVMGLPAGYKTVVGERGASLSGGQRQRLTIARALVLRPSVLVFDDSTAAIDAGTELRIRSAIKRFAKDRVTLVISHRLGALMHADQILFIENGEVLERGSHDELLALNGRYRALYDLQVRPETDLREAG